MNNQWVLTQESFDALMTWLDPNREEAGQKYERIRQRLIRIFGCRGCNEAEELADETINRVARKSTEIKDSYVGDPIKYFCGVAHKVYLEYLRRKKLPPPPQPTPDNDLEVEHGCLDKCIEKLTPERRQLFYEYFEEEKAPKIARRKRLAEQLGIGLNALRIRAHRVRATLEQCVKSCVHQLQRAGTD